MLSGYQPSLCLTFSCSKTSLKMMRWVMYNGFFFFRALFCPEISLVSEYKRLNTTEPWLQSRLLILIYTNIDLLIWLGLEHKHSGPCFIFCLVYCLPLFVLLQRDIHTMSRGTTLFSRGTVGEFIHNSLFVLCFLSVNGPRRHQSS